MNIIEESDRIEVIATAIAQSAGRDEYNFDDWVAAELIFERQQTAI